MVVYLDLKLSNTNIREIQYNGAGIMTNQKGIQIVRRSKDNHVAISRESVEISHKGKPVSGAAAMGYVYLIVDCLGG